MWNYRILVKESGEGNKVGVFNLETSKLMTKPELESKVRLLFKKFQGVEVLEWILKVH